MDIINKGFKVFKVLKKDLKFIMLLKLLHYINTYIKLI